MMQLYITVISLMENGAGNIRFATEGDPISDQDFKRPSLDT